MTPLKRTRRTISVLASVGLAAALFNAAVTRIFAQSPSTPPGGAAWVSAPSLSGQLGPEEHIGGYAIRPPAGYTEKTVTLTAPDGSGVRTIWTGPAGAGGIAPYLQMDVGTDNGVLSSRTSSDAEVHIGFDAAAQNHVNMVTSAIEKGTINGLAFSRGYWKGYGPKTGKMFHGLVYARVASPVVITLVGRDAEPSYRQSLPLLEASIQTVRKL